MCRKLYFIRKVKINLKVLVSHIWNALFHIKILLAVKQNVSDIDMKKQQ